MASAEFVREMFLCSRETYRAKYRAPLPSSLASLIERMFRYTWFRATDKHDAMVREGRQDELDKLVAEARAFSDRSRLWFGPSSVTGACARH